MNTSLIALLGFSGLTLLLPFLVVNYRTLLVVGRKQPANAWGRDKNPDNPGLIVRMQHAHLNCLENLPVFASIVLVAHATGLAAVVDPLAMSVLYLRLGQTGTHLISASGPAVLLRAVFYVGQVVIMGWMLFQLLTA